VALVNLQIFLLLVAVAVVVVVAKVCLGQTVAVMAAISTQS
jgi:hypothetical protein